MLTRIGDVEIWRILELIEPMRPPAGMYPGITEEDEAFVRRTVPRQICPDTGAMLLPIQGFLLRTPRHVILVDACIGNGKTVTYNDAWHQRSGGRFMAGLQAAGVAPEDVDFVMCTHLHVDHVGWNTRLENGKWVPTFPNARYLLPAADNAHFGADPTPIYTESVLPVIAAGQAELVGPDHMLGDHLSLIPTHGHTPGHMSVRIAGGGRDLVITGDALHSPVQCARPDWHFAFDADPVQAVAARRSLLSQCCDGGAAVLGSHFPLPSFGAVRAVGDAFDWIED